jgi:hypothetical protein
MFYRNMRTSLVLLWTILAVSLFSGVVHADVPSGPSCKCDVGASTSVRGTAAACTAFGLSVLLIGRKRARKQ